MGILQYQARPGLRLVTPILSLALLSVCSLVGLGSGCKPPEEPPDESEAAEDEALRISRVEAAVLESTTFSETLELTGETEPIRFAHVSAQVGGRIDSLELVEHQAVNEGTNVLRIDARQVRATVDRLEVQLNGLEDDIERSERLIERGIGREADLDLLEDQRDSTAAAIDEAEVGVRQSRTRAPISGIVSEIYYEEGEWVAQGTDVARIIDINTIVVEVGLPERHITFVAEGLEVEVRIEATGQVLSGTIAQIGLEANSRNRTFPVEVHIDNQDGRLRSGMRTTVLLTRRTIDDALVIPRDAILQAVNGHEVMVIEDGIATSRAVRMGVGRDRWVVIDDGLSVGEVLVVRGQRTLVQGEPVEIVRQQACCGEQLENDRDPFERSDPLPEIPSSPPPSDPDTTPEQSEVLDADRDG